MPLDRHQKQIFIKIIKEHDGGKFEKILNRGTSTSMQKHDVWTAVMNLFNRATGEDQSVKQLRGLYQRLKDQSKKNHDAEINRRFTSSCAATGGGRGPSPPPEFDGDLFNTEDDLDIMDPTPTPWNGLTTTRPGSSDRPAGPSQSSGLESPSVPESPQSQQARRRSIPQFVPEASSASSLGTPEQITPRESLITPSSGRRPGPQGVRAIRSGGAEVAGDNPRQTVTIIDENGDAIVAPVVPPETTGNRQANKRKKKETNAEAGSKYYSEMLVMQRSMMSLRMKYIKSKMLTELMKQAALKDCLEEKGLEIPMLEVSDESDSDGEDDDEEDNNNIFS